MRVPLYQNTPRGPQCPAVEPAHEAIVNAVKHAQPTRISVDVQIDGRLLRLLVCDDGSGFPFRGRYPHQALVDGNLGPASLRERAASLGGEMSIESSANGSKVEIAVPLWSVVS